MVSYFEFIPVLKHCHFGCCSCKIRTLAIILAWLEIIGTASQFVTHLTYIEDYGRTVTTLGIFDSVRFNLLVLSVAAASLLIDGMLVYGIHMKKALYMLPFILLDLFGSSLCAVVLLLLLGNVYMTESLEDTIILLAVGLTFLFISGLFWIVMYSYYQQLKSEDMPQFGTSVVTYRSES